MSHRAPAVTFLARSLGLGGAERQLLTLARALQVNGHRVSIVTFYDEPPGMDVSGLDVRSAGKKGRYDLMDFSHRLRAVVASTDPDILHSYLVTPNIASALINTKLRLPLVWDLRAADMDLKKYGRFERATFALTRRLARRPHAIAVNSTAGLQHHRVHGYPIDKMVLINNGIDTDHFAPDRGARDRVRSAWGVGQDATVVGMVAREDPAKGHEIFCQMAGLVAQASPDVTFVCIGTSAPAIEALAVAAGAHIRVEGPRNDLPAVYSSFDLAVSSSWTEGFPNVVAEAMACETPVVATDAGDSAVILGDGSNVVAVGDAAGLAETVLAKLKKGKPALEEEGRLARLRVTKEFSVGRMVESYQRLYGEVIARCAASAGR